MTLEEEVVLGARAAEVIENEAYIAAYEAVEKELVEQWKQSPVRDSDGRERIFLALGMLSKVKNALEQTMQSGSVARVNLEHKRKMSERVKDAWQSLGSE